MDRPKIAAWFVDGEITPDDPLAHVKLKARERIAEAEERERDERKAAVKARAAAVAEVADLAHSEAFDLDEVGAAATERFGADVVDAAFDVVYELMQVERRRR